MHLEGLLLPAILAGIINHRKCQVDTTPDLKSTPTKIFSRDQLPRFFSRLRDQLPRKSILSRMRDQLESRGSGRELKTFRSSAAARKLTKGSHKLILNSSKMLDYAGWQTNIRFPANLLTGCGFGLHKIAFQGRRS